MFTSCVYRRARRLPVAALEYRGAVLGFLSSCASRSSRLAWAGEVRSGKGAGRGNGCHDDHCRAEAAADRGGR